nr:hypothetical protein [Halorussus sp. MSC15.2]
MVPRVRERERGGLVAREQERDHLVADLGLRHRGAVRSLGVEQDGEQVVVLVLAVGPAFGYQVVHHRLEVAHGAVEPPVLRRRHPVGEERRRAAGVAAVVQRRRRLPDDRPSPFHVHVEQRLGQNLERQFRHRVAHVHDRAVREVVAESVGVGHHRVGVAPNLLGRERRLDADALVAPDLAFGEQQALLGEPGG